MKTALTIVASAFVFAQLTSPIRAENTVIAEAPGPILAFCRSGTRSIVTWSLGQAASGARSRQELADLGRAAGYDLSGVLGV